MVLAGTAAMLGVGLTEPALAEGRKFIVTEPIHGVGNLPFYIGIKKGFFTDVGLDVQVVTSEGGGRHIAAVLSGDAHAFIGGPEHIAFARVKGGQPLRAVISMSNRANVFLVAHKNVKIDASKSLGENLRGKRIAVSTRGGTGYSILSYLLKNEGLDARKDVVLLEIASSAGRLAAVKAGQADIAATNEPTIAQGIKAGVWKEPFAGMPDVLGLFAWTTINIPLKVINAEPELVQSVVNAMKKALEFTFANPEEVDQIAKAEFPTLPEEQRKAMIKRVLDNKMWQQDGSMPREAWDKLLAIVKISGMLKKDVAYEEVFEPKFLK